jgi:hypothetical protein
MHFNFQNGGGGHLESGRSLPFCIFDFGEMSRTYLSIYIGIRRKLIELLVLVFFKMAAAAILDSMIGDL